MFPVELDLHTHTIASGHGSCATITDMAKAASARGLKLLGISDHGPATPGGGKPSYFQNLAQAPKKRFGVEMLYGAEASILDHNGTLDLPDHILKNLDYTIASMHRPVKAPGTKEENTQAFLMAMKNPCVRIIGHCDDVKYPVDYPALVEAAIEHRVLIEINESSLRPDGYRGDVRENDLAVLRLCRSHSWPVLLSSDSHGTARLGSFTYAARLLKEAGIPEELILNLSVRSLRAFLCMG